MVLKKLNLKYKLSKKRTVTKREKNFKSDHFRWPYLGVAPRRRRGSGTSKTPEKVGPHVGPDGPTANSKSKFPKI